MFTYYNFRFCLVIWGIYLIIKPPYNILTIINTVVWLVLFGAMIFDAIEESKKPSKNKKEVQ